MRRGRFGRGLLAFALTASAAALVAACISSRSSELEPRYVAVHNALAAMGMAQIGPIQRGSLAEGREVRVRLELPAQCTTVVVLGGAGVRDIDVALLDGEARPLARDTTDDAQAVVRACPEKGGAFALVVKMTKGAGDFVAATWSGTVASPLPAPSAPASSLAAGTCEAPTPLTAGTVHATTRRGEAEHSAACASSEGKELVYKLDLAPRQRVTIEVDPQFDSVLYVRKDSCEDAADEVACNDDMAAGSKSSNRGSRIDEVFEPGTYYVFVDGYGNEGGSFRMNVALTDVPSLANACRQAPSLAAAKTSAVLAPGAFDSVHASCAGESKGPDAVHRLDVAARSRVRVIEQSADFSPVVHLRRTCTDEKSEAGCAGSGILAEEATFTGLLDPGTYSVFADSSEKAAQGRYTLDVELGSEQGAGVKGDACGDAITLTTNEKSVQGDTFAARDDVAGKCSPAGAPDVVYRFDLARRSRVSARFTAQEGNHVFVLHRSCADRASEIACTANVDEVLPPGTYWLAVDGATKEDFGRFAFALSARDVSAQEATCRAPPAIAAGQKITSTTVGAGDKFTASCAGREDAQANPDRVYKLTVASRTRVELRLSTPSWDGVLSLRKSCLDPPSMRSARAAEVACNNDAGDTRHSKIETTLEPGTYFVVVDGNSTQNEGAFTLEYAVRK